MPLTFHPRLVNGPSADPGLYVPFCFDNRAFIFDLGSLGVLSNRDLLKIDVGFITHTHMDHFIGFDPLLRLFLGRDKTLHLYGPEGFLKHVEGKLSGYAWNLVENYSNRFVLRVTEVCRDCRMTREYHCSQAFSATNPIETEMGAGLLHPEPGLSVSAVILDHQIPCLGYALQERFHINIKKSALESLELEVGPWLREFKTALFEGVPGDSEFIVKSQRGGPERHFSLGELAGQIAVITPGQKIAYITDAVFHEENAEKIVAIAKDADQLFIESAFLESDRLIAERKFHLTARQAGELAGRAGVRRFFLFHFSPRYGKDTEAMWREADKAYHAAAAYR
ncbi:MAG: ribonuclease Z [Thermodesulfobacteriota bacterium]